VCRKENRRESVRGHFAVSRLQKHSVAVLPLRKRHQTTQSGRRITRRHHLSAKGYQQRLEAGLLTSGSTRVTPFPPDWLLKRSDADWQWICDSVPGYSGGTATELHRLPFSVVAVEFKHDKYEHLNRETSRLDKPRRNASRVSLPTGNPFAMD